MADSIQVYLDSRNATQYINSTNVCQYTLPQMVIDSQYHFIVSVVDASIPHSFYNINSYNNQIQWIEDPYGTFVAHNAIIPQGNYDINSLVTQLQVLMPELTITYSQLTGKLTFVHPTLNFAFYSANNTCFELLGFSNMNQFSGSRTLTSDNVCNIFTIRSLCICTNFHTSNIHLSRTHMHNMIACIPVNASPNSIILYQNQRNYRCDLFDNIINDLVISFRDQNGNVINLNGCHYNLTLQFDIYKFVE